MASALTFPLVPFPIFVFSPVSLKLPLLRNSLSSLRWWQKIEDPDSSCPSPFFSNSVPSKFCVPRTLPWLHLQTLLFPHMHPTLFAHSFSICISLLSDSSLSLGDKSARLELLCKEGSFAICHHMGPKAKSSAKRLNQVCRTKCYELTLWVYNFMPFVAICLSKQPPFHTNTQKSLPCSQGFSTGVTVPPFSSFPLSIILSFQSLSIHIHQGLHLGVWPNTDLPLHSSGNLKGKKKPQQNKQNKHSNQESCCREWGALLCLPSVKVHFCTKNKKKRKKILEQNRNYRKSWANKQQTAKEC